MHAAKNLVICCAAEAEELGLDVPTCLVPVLGRPLIHWQLDLVGDFENVIIVVGCKASKVVRAVRETPSGAVFIVNHDHRTTNPLDSLAIAVADLDEPFVYMEGNVLATSEALRLVQAAPCPAIAVKQTRSEDPVCAEMGSGDLVRKVVGFTSELREYEWTGLAKLTPEHVRAAADRTHVYQALECALPVDAVEIDCMAVRTLRDHEEAQTWARERLVNGMCGRAMAA